MREGIRTAGGIAFEFPVHPIQETGKRPTAALDRNLAYLGLVEVLFGYPLDGVVLMTGCDKTTPACLMAAATVNTPAIVLSGGPMLDGYHDGKLAGSGTALWQARQDIAAGKIDYNEFIDIVADSAPSIGHCNTMGTASTMNAMAEALGMSLPGCAAIPAPYRERARSPIETGVRAVEIVREDLKPSDILTRAAFENAIVACSAIGGSTNAPIHLNAIARHIGVELSIGDWEKIGYDVPLLVNMQPAGAYLGEDYFRAGGLPAVMHELMAAGRLHGDALTINGKTIAENVEGRQGDQCRGHRALRQAAQASCRFQGLARQSVRLRDHEDERHLGRIPPALSQRSEAIRMPSRAALSCSTARRIITTASTIRRSRSTSTLFLFMRGAGPIGYPGSAEVVNMQPPAALIKKGVTSLACIGDGRQSGTSGSPSILNASPEAAAGGGLALLQTGDRVRIDLNKGTADILISPAELAERAAALKKNGGYHYPPSETPWQEIQRAMVDQLGEGMVLEPAIKYQRVAQKFVPRDNH